ncbi:hypothetical protein [Pseudomonas moraviensis]|uniref:hypothetical protein n=1 Tax=Pseudomonas moraviensis TaxID=321662 RepID=UPI001E617699|nr:hypothetical protein [Pseudomonas moraviensis]
MKENLLLLASGHFVQFDDKGHVAVPALVDGHRADDGKIAVPRVVHAEEVA